MIASKHPMRLCIHGHFYQPPRENPWTGRIETQPSAAPHHDWNERIAHQCYAPNGASRLLDPRGRIRGMLNNYRYMSFNFGPTLLDWLEEHFPETMARIVEADRLSREEQNGHGNALAQVYNHAIMPLGTRRDRRTQIAWGIRDFESRFGRRPEGMWLAETAINMDTVVDLIEQGIQFTVLSPTQAARVRPFDHEDWRSVENNEIDPTRPYRVFPLQENGEPLCAGHLDVFFYDGPVSTAVSFEHLLRDAKRFADRLSQAWNPGSDRPQLVSIATDGESYGHHEPFGDMALAYLFETICPERGIIPTNFGHFLELHPPVEEVRLKNAHDEGTAWSCSHGTGRWIRDCGCHTGAPEGWNQAWRGPLREAMSLVRDAAEQAWDKLAPQLVIEPWKCRIDWMSVHRGLLPREEFHARHMLDAAKERNRSRLALLLELVKMGQYCLTSCGWFFNDISGIEPVQNMRYAYRACDILAALGELSPEEDVRRILERAKSNMNAWTGRSIWDMWVRPGIAFDRQLAGQILFERMLSGGEGPVTLHGIRLDPKLSEPREGVRTGTVAIEHLAFEARATLHVLGWRDPSGRLEARVLPAGVAPGPVDWSLSGDSLRKAIELAWPARPIRLQDLLHDKRLELGHSVVATAHQRLRPAIDALVRQGAPTVDELLELGLPVPDFLRVPEQVVLEEQLLGFVEKTLAHPGAVAPEEVQALVQRARLLGVDDTLRVPADRVAQALWNLFGKIEQSPSETVCEAFVLLLELADGAGLALDKTDLENAGNRLRVRQLQPILRHDAPSSSDLAKARIWVRALQRLNFDVDVEAEAMELAAFRKAEEK